MNLKLSTLESFHQHRDADGHQDFYAKNGTSKGRLRRLLEHPPCSCGCKLPFSTLRKCCQSFWSLPKHLQDSVLWSLQCESGRKKTWAIEGLMSFQMCSKLLCVSVWHSFLSAGHQLCRQSWLKYLGIGKQRILRTKRKFRGVDGRTLNQGFLIASFQSIHSKCLKIHHPSTIFFILYYIYFNPAPCKELQCMKQSKPLQQCLSSCICTGARLSQWQQSCLVVC